MKFLLFSLVAVASLSGCAYYGDPYYGAYGYPAYYGGVAYPGAVYPSVTVGVAGGHRDFPHGWRDSEGHWSDHR